MGYRGKREEALVEEQPGTPGNFPGLFKVAGEKYPFSPAQISGQNDKTFLICPKFWFANLIRELRSGCHLTSLKQCTNESRVSESRDSAHVME